MIDINKNHVTCINHFLGRCKDCKEDYDTQHHPNNLDCPYYKTVKYLILTIKKIPDTQIPH